MPLVWDVPLSFIFKRFKLHFVFLVLLVSSSLTAGYLVDNNPYRQWEMLDNDGKYELEWIVNWEDSRILFNVTVQTRGYVGFGLSLKGKMSGADLVIGGVMPDGRPYFTDRHAIGNQLPELDDSQDWTLHEARENSTHTFMSFSRLFETCDEDHDLPIHGDVIGLIWAFGEKDDEIEYHYHDRGLKYAYLLNPELIPREMEPSNRAKNPGASLGHDFDRWTIISKTEIMPQQPTTYICTIHKAPVISSKQHIVGFNSILETDLERKHIHHFLLHRCIPPLGQDPTSVFERHVGGSGEECYPLRSPGGSIPTQYCTEVVHVWAVGGRAVFFPDHVGLPLSVRESGDEYFMLQMHYDNPDLLRGVELSWALEVFYTKPRQYDAGMLAIGGLTPGSPSLMVPPSSLEHFIYGHCGSSCTQKILPREGIRVFAANLHTHLAGRGMRLLHIRDNKELPWIIYDNNYNFNYQQNRILRNEIEILPGDTTINRCMYETTDRNGSVTVGGFSTRNEMCSGFMWYYNRIPNYAVCRSEIRSDVYKSFLNIWNTTWSDERIENVVTAPTQNEGLVVSEVGNSIEWTIERRNQIQQYHRYLPQITGCPSLVEEDGESSQAQQQKLPTLRRYNPIRRNSIRNVNRNRTNSATATSENGILDPEYEFVSIYPEDIVPYELPDLCRRR